MITPPEMTHTDPGFNRGSGGGARGCGFEERVGVHARTGGDSFPIQGGFDPNKTRRTRPGEVNIKPNE